MAVFLLTSAGFINPHIADLFLQLINKKTASTRILFIPAAALTEVQKGLVAESREELLQLGVTEENLIEYHLDHPLTNEEADSIDVIYVCGGNTLHLLTKIKEAGFDSQIVQMTNVGKLYVGISAGCIVLGPRVREQEGLNLINTIVYPHYTPNMKEQVETLEEKTGCSVTPLTDNQALLVCNGRHILSE